MALFYGGKYFIRRKSWSVPREKENEKLLADDHRSFPKRLDGFIWCDFPATTALTRGLHLWGGHCCAGAELKDTVTETMWHLEQSCCESNDPKMRARSRLMCCNPTTSNSGISSTLLVLCCAELPSSQKWDKCTVDLCFSSLCLTQPIFTLAHTLQVSPLHHRFPSNKSWLHSKQWLNISNRRKEKPANYQSGGGEAHEKAKQWKINFSRGWFSVNINTLGGGKKSVFLHKGAPQRHRWVCGWTVVVDTCTNAGLMLAEK